MFGGESESPRFFSVPQVRPGSASATAARSSSARLRSSGIPGSAAWVDESATHAQDTESVNFRGANIAWQKLDAALQFDRAPGDRGAHERPPSCTLTYDLTDEWKQFSARPRSAIRSASFGHRSSTPIRSSNTAAAPGPPQAPTEQPSRPIRSPRSRTAHRLAAPLSLMESAMRREKWASSRGRSERSWCALNLEYDTSKYYTSTLAAPNLGKSREPRGSRSEAVPRVVSAVSVDENAVDQSTPSRSIDLGRRQSRESWVRATNARYRSVNASFETGACGPEPSVLRRHIASVCMAKQSPGGPPRDLDRERACQRAPFTNPKFDLVFRRPPSARMYPPGSKRRSSITEPSAREDSPTLDLLRALRAVRPRAIHNIRF